MVLFGPTLLLLGFTILFNILGHQRCFRHKARKVRQILLRGSNFGLRFIYVPYIYDTGPTALLPFRTKSYSGFLRSEKIHRPRLGWNPRTSDPEESMITTRPPRSTRANAFVVNIKFFSAPCTLRTLSCLELYWIIIIIITVCPRPSLSLQTQEPRLQFCRRQVFHRKLRNQGCSFTRD